MSGLSSDAATPHLPPLNLLAGHHAPSNKLYWSPSNPRNLHRSPSSRHHRRRTARAVVPGFFRALNSIGGTTFYTASRAALRRLWSDICPLSCSRTCSWTPRVRDVLLGVLARGGAAAALVPDLVKDGLQASPDVAATDATTIERSSHVSRGGVAAAQMPLFRGGVAYDGPSLGPRLTCHASWWRYELCSVAGRATG
jgi:hypothetical protein